uniref:Retrotransposon gag domain-containing protein n=1 Tax=Brassica oleracea TaxID=3712 RepID=A0A3P6FA53_BRAOL|nr:unnamed protein product [Brassica oleracea]
MPPRRRTIRAQTARAVRDNVDEHEQPAVPPPAAPPVDQDALRQMVQDAARQAAQEALQQIAQEAARQAAQEAARVAAQEVARQMAAVQQGPQIQVQQVPLVQVQQDHQIPAQHDHQDPVQQVPLPQVPLQQGPVQQFAHGVQDLPPPPPRPHVYPVYNERFYRLTCQMRNMEMEHFKRTRWMLVAAHDWKLALQRKLEIIECPPELSLRLTMQYLRGDALIWWEGIRLNHFGPERLTFADFIREFDRKYFPKEAMDRKKCEFEHTPTTPQTEPGRSRTRLPKIRLGARVKHTRLRRPAEPPRIQATRRRLRPTFAGAAVTDHRPFAAEKLPPRRRLAAVAAVDFSGLFLFGDGYRVGLLYAGLYGGHSQL